MWGSETEGTPGVAARAMLKATAVCELEDQS